MLKLLYWTWNNVKTIQIVNLKKKKPVQVIFWCLTVSGSEVKNISSHFLFLFNFFSIYLFILIKWRSRNQEHVEKYDTSFVYFLWQIINAKISRVSKRFTETSFFIETVDSCKNEKQVPEYKLKTSVMAWDDESYKTVDHYFPYYFVIRMRKKAIKISIHKIRSPYSSCTKISSFSCFWSSWNYWLR